MTKNEILNLKDRTTIVIENGILNNKVVTFFKENIKEVEENGSKKCFYIFDGERIKLSRIRLATNFDIDCYISKKKEQVDIEEKRLYSDLKLTNEDFLIKKQDLSNKLYYLIEELNNFIDDNDYKFKMIYKKKDENWNEVKEFLKEKVDIIYYLIHDLDNDVSDYEALGIEIDKFD